MFQNSRRETGSTPLVGSSRKSTRGVWMSAQESPSFCFIPPDRLPARRRRKGPRPENSRSPGSFSFPFAPGDAVQVGVEAEVLRDGQVGVEPEPLAHVADLALDRRRLRADGAAHHPGVAFRGVEDPRQEAHDGGLPRAVGPHQAEDLPFLDGERQPVHGDGAAEDAAQALGADRLRHGPALPQRTVIAASAGMPGRSSRAGFGTSTFTR